jgi:hypothetical protein
MQRRKPCTNGKIRDLETGKCKCPPGQTFDRIEKICRDKKRPGKQVISQPRKQIQRKPCTNGKIRDLETGKCKCPPGQTFDTPKKICRDKKRPGRKPVVISLKKPSPMRQSPARQSPMRQSPLRQSPLRQSQIVISVKRQLVIQSPSSPKRQSQSPEEYIDFELTYPKRILNFMEEDTQVYNSDDEFLDIGEYF